MAKVIHCDCGFVVRGETDQEVVAIATRHARDVHGMEITPEQVLALVSQPDRTGERRDVKAIVQQPLDDRKVEGRTQGVGTSTGRKEMT